jgi:hypothetical protein
LGNASRYREQQFFYQKFKKTFIMKTREFGLIMLVAALTLTFVSCSDSVDSLEDLTTLGQVDEKSEEIEAICGYCDFSGTLNENEIAGLMEMREEEKLAKQVYVFFFEKYNYRIFNNISKSEDAHARAVLYLINGYGLLDPTPENDTEFSNPLFGELYAQLTQNGSASLSEALKAGAFIEEHDIADLRRLIAETENENIKRVYGNLLRASVFHLRAFTNVLKIQGQTYVPSILSPEEYNELLNGDNDDEEETTASGTFTPPANCPVTGQNS